MSVDSIQDIKDKFESIISALDDIDSLLQEIVLDNTQSYKLNQEIDSLIYHVIDVAQVQGIDISADIFQE